MEFDYRLVKLLHMLGGILFVGNILVTAVWKLAADRTREPAVLAFAQRLVGLTDVLFTGPGAGLLLATGVLLGHAYAAEYDGAFWKIGWLATGLGLFALSGLIWIAVLVPLQLQQGRMVREFERGGAVPPAYWRLARLWAVFGVVASVLPLISLYLMVLRPF